MANEILSIRLSADGLSFWTDDSAESFGTEEMLIYGGAGESVSANYPVPERGEEIEPTIMRAVSEFCGILQSRGLGLPGERIVYADTLSTVLVPARLFCEGDAERYVRMHGWDLSDDRYTVCSKPVHGTVAVTILPLTVTTALGKAFGEFAVLSPLQYNLCTAAAAPDAMKNGKGHIRIFSTPFNCYVTAFKNNTTVYADCHPLGSAADIVYYLDWIVTRYGAGNWTAVIDGHRSQEIAALASKKFRGKICG